MKRKHLSILVWLLFFTCSIYPENLDNKKITSESEQTKIDSLISKYTKACGGEALKEVLSEQGKGTLVRYQTGFMPFTFSASNGNKFSYHQIFSWGDQLIFSSDGSQGWVQSKESVESMDSDQLRDMQMIFDSQFPLKLKERFTSFSIRETQQLKDKEVVIVDAVDISGNKIDLAFDTQSGFLLKAGKVYFEDYRTVGNIKRPFRILLGSDEGEIHRQMKMQFTEIVQNNEVDNSQFSSPNCILPLVDAPLYKTRKLYTASNHAMEKCVGLYEDTNRKEFQFRIFKEGDHLFIDLIGRGFKIEIIPDGEYDYYTKFLGWDFHFDENESGEINNLTIKASFTINAVRVES